MWSRHIFLFTLFTFAILDSQCHVIHKRGLISKLFGGGSKSSNRDIESDLPPKERSKFRELLKNPIVISMLSAAVGMVVQQALQARNMGDVCEHQYVKMAYTASNFSPELQRVLTLLGCHGPKGQKGTTKSPGGGKFSTTPAYGADEEEEESPDNEQDTTNDDADRVESSFSPEKESKMKQIVSIVRGEKGAKRNFVKNLFGLNKKDKTFKPGHKLPSSSYKLDKDDANALKDLENDLEKYNKSIH